MKKIKKYIKTVVEIIIFVFALAVFVYSGYKIASYYHLLPLKVSAEESCGSCSSCVNSGWFSDFCRRIKDWCQHSCPCYPSPTAPPPQPTPTTEPTPTTVEPTPSGGVPTPTPTPTGEAGEPTPTSSQPTATPTPAGTGGEVSTGGGGGGGGGGGPASPCTPPEAPKTPTLLSAVAVSNSEVKLTWTKVDRATHYAIAYGEVSHNYTYGNANVGDTDSYTVGGLTTGKTYYFAVSAAIGGDCPVASPYSNELSAKPGIWGAVAGARITSAPEEEKPEGELGSGISTQAGEVKGAESKCPCPFWAISLLIEAVLIGSVLSFWLAKRPLPSFWWLSIPLAVLLTYLLDRYAHTHWYDPSRMCQYEPYLGVVLAGAEIAGFKFLRQSRNKK